MDLDFWPRQNVYNVPVLDHSLIYNKIYATSYTPARHIYTQQYWYMSSNNNNNNIILVLKNIPPSQVKVWELRQTNWVPSATESKFWEQRVRNLRSSSAEANWESKFSKISSVTDLPPSLAPSLPPWQLSSVGGCNRDDGLGPKDWFSLSLSRVASFFFFPLSSRRI